MAWPPHPPIQIPLLLELLKQFRCSVGMDLLANVLQFLIKNDSAVSSSEKNHQETPHIFTSALTKRLKQMASGGRTSAQGLLFCTEEPKESATDTRRSPWSPFSLHAGLQVWISYAENQASSLSRIHPAHSRHLSPAHSQPVIHRFVKIHVSL